MVVSTCQHEQTQKYGKDRKGNQRLRCTLCGQTFAQETVRPLGSMRIDLKDAATVLSLLLEGMSIRAAERITGMNRDTICDLKHPCRQHKTGNLSGQTSNTLVGQYPFKVRKRCAICSIAVRGTFPFTHLPSGWAAASLAGAIWPTLPRPMAASFAKRRFPTRCGTLRGGSCDLITQSARARCGAAG